MISDYRCFYCFVRAFERTLGKSDISKEAKAKFTRDMVNFYNSEWDNLNSPDFARELHRILRSYTNNPDPYKEEKRRYNDIALSLVPELRKKLNQNNQDRFLTALRLSIAGNIIDFAACDNFNLEKTIAMALESQLAIDNSEKLRLALQKAGSVLFLGDNAGEIVFDKLFIEVLNHPNLTYVVKGAPVINDATMEDAEYTDMKGVARVISSGYDAPSTVFEKSSPELQEHFRKADLIISKGQGNLEGLFALNDKRIFFLLMVKCDVMAEFLKVRKNSLVVYNPEPLD